MAYDNFTKQTVFVDQNINTIFNRMYDALDTEFTAVVVAANFCITGTVSKIIQGDTPSPLEVVSFITDSIDIYEYCASTLPKILGVTAVKFKDRIEYNYKGTLFEIWLDSSLGTVNTMSSFKVQDPTSIPIQIK